MCKNPEDCLRLENEFWTQSFKYGTGGTCYESNCIYRLEVISFKADNSKLKAIEFKVTVDKVGGSDETDNLTEEIGFIVNTSSKPRYGIIVGPKKNIQERRLQFERSN